MRPNQYKTTDAVKPRNSLSINPWVVKGRLPLKLYSGSDGTHVRTDENPEVFVPCGFFRPGANARGKTRKTQKSGVQPLFRRSRTRFYRVRKLF